MASFLHSSVGDEEEYFAHRVHPFEINATPEPSVMNALQIRIPDDDFMLSPHIGDQSHFSPAKSPAQVNIPLKNTDINVIAILDEVPIERPKIVTVKKGFTLPPTSHVHILDKDQQPYIPLELAKSITAELKSQKEKEKEITLDTITQIELKFRILSEKQSAIFQKQLQTLKERAKLHLEEMNRRRERQVEESDAELAAIQFQLGLAKSRESELIGSLKTTEENLKIETERSTELIESAQTEINNLKSHLDKLVQERTVMLGAVALIQQVEYTLENKQFDNMATINDKNNTNESLKKSISIYSDKTIDLNSDNQTLGLVKSDIHADAGENFSPNLLQSAAEEGSLSMMEDEADGRNASADLILETSYPLDASFKEIDEDKEKAVEEGSNSIELNPVVLIQKLQNVHSQLSHKMKEHSELCTEHEKTLQLLHEVETAHENCFQVADRQAETAAALQIATQQLETAQANLDAAESAHKIAESTISQLEEQKNVSESEVKELKFKIQALEASVIALEEKSNNLSNEALDEMRSEISTVKVELDEKNKILENIQNNLIEKEKELIILKENMVIASAIVDDKAAVVDGIMDEKQEIIHLKNKVKELEEQLLSVPFLLSVDDDDGEDKENDDNRNLSELINDNTVLLADNLDKNDLDNKESSLVIPATVTADYKQLQTKIKQLQKALNTTLSSLKAQKAENEALSNRIAELEETEMEQEDESPSRSKNAANNSTSGSRPTSRGVSPAALRGGLGDATGKFVAGTAGAAVGFVAGLASDVGKSKSSGGNDAQRVKQLEMELKSTEAAHRKQLKDLNDKINKSSKGSGSDIVKLTNQLEKSKEKIATLEAALLTANDSLKKVTLDGNSASTELKELRNKLAAAEKIAAEVAALKSTLQESKAELDSVQTQYQAERLKRIKLHNELEDLRGKVRVFCRIRPTNEREAKMGSSTCCEAVDEFSLKVVSKGQPKMFEFDRVYGSQSTQDEVFEDVKRLVYSAIDGYNVCVFAYGQTGSGKTHTIQGSPADKGLTPRAIDELFTALNAMDGRRFSWTVEFYMLELYNKKFADLLVEKKKLAPGEKEIPVEVRMDANNQAVRITGTTIKRATSAEELEITFLKGLSQRTTHATAMNATSSRSHLVFAIMTSVEDKSSGKISKGKLSFIDLAGSERASKTEASGDRLKEGREINMSLSALGDVIAALSSNGAGGNQHVPYRNHELTVLMSDSLGGAAKTLMFVNVSPAEFNCEETITSLNYAARAKNIQNKATKNLDNAEVAKLKRKIQDLMEENARLRVVSGMSADSRDDEAVDSNAQFSSNYDEPS